MYLEVGTGLLAFVVPSVPLQIVFCQQTRNVNNYLGVVPIILRLLSDLLFSNDIPEL